MGRKRQSTAKDFVELVALMPWWAGIGLAVVSYVIFHRLAAPPASTGLPPANVVYGALVSVLSNIGQYLVPLLCCSAALISAVRRKKRTDLMDRATGSASMSAVSEMSWQEFELLIGEAFRLQGFSVVERGGGGADGGIDLVLRRDGEKFLVQCKHWRSLKVGVTVARELFGVMAAEGAAGGYVVTGGEFTAEAKAFAEGRNLRLVDGSKLAGMLRQARAKSAPPSSPAPAKSRPVEAATSAAVPACPTCQATMVKRTAKKGQAAGTQFWGCSRYPACRGTR